MSKERIVFTADATEAELKFEDKETADSIGTVSGYVMKWNTLSSDRGGYRVRLLPNSAQAESRVRGLWNHQSIYSMGDTENKYLRLTPDAIGVKFELDLPNTTAGRDVKELIRTNRMKGMSFAMSAKPKGQRVKEGDTTVFNAESFPYDEVSLTDNPAFVDTSVSLKSYFCDMPSDSAETKKDLVAERLKLKKDILDIYRAE